MDKIFWRQVENHLGSLERWELIVGIEDYEKCLLFLTVYPEGKNPFTYSGSPDNIRVFVYDCHGGENDTVFFASSKAEAMEKLKGEIHAEVFILSSLLDTFKFVEENLPTLP